MSQGSNFDFIYHVLIVFSNIFEEVNATIFSVSLNRVDFFIFGKKLACERYTCLSEMRPTFQRTETILSFQPHQYAIDTVCHCKDGGGDFFETSVHTSIIQRAESKLNHQLINNSRKNLKIWNSKRFHRVSLSGDFALLFSLSFIFVRVFVNDLKGA